MDWNDPQQRLAYLEANGIKAYNKAINEWKVDSTVAVVGEYRIRTIESGNWGCLFTVADPNGDNKMAFTTLKQAKEYAESQTFKLRQREFYDAAVKLLAAWENGDQHTEAYPFAESFDEVVYRIGNWVSAK